ncbi:uncharacterized protein APUU_10500S [Aspergillus puulaauensis]|uniref:Uncharacterized protein n=1 Tax=Aspergillus puulaauensis TaxID=1220207 RepID=A0A7R7XA74_9EURO|nr:uncharacterized protein APUU_10500S [Aspergillus puulaauensis]BCS17672.1 hypothetical protein APUU_10500S [Aspergillus puulaauensis]
MKPSFVILPLSLVLPGVFAACKTNEKYCGNGLTDQLGYRKEQVLSAAQKNKDLPPDARSEDWMNVIFNCVDGENIEALYYCGEPDVCDPKHKDGTGAVCQFAFFPDDDDDDDY